MGYTADRWSCCPQEPPGRTSDMTLASLLVEVAAQDFHGERDSNGFRGKGSSPAGQPGSVCAEPVSRAGWLHQNRLSPAPGSVLSRKVGRLGGGGAVQLTAPKSDEERDGGTEGRRREEGRRRGWRGGRDFFPLPNAGSSWPAGLACVTGWPGPGHRLPWGRSTRERGSRRALRVSGSCHFLTLLLCFHASYSARDPWRL